MLEGAQQSAAEIAAQTGMQTLAVEVDVSSLESAKAMVEEAMGRFGKVDILVNNAGITRDDLISAHGRRRLGRGDRYQPERCVELLQSSHPGDDESPLRRIVNISSVSGLAGQAGQTNYSASKAGRSG